MDDSSTQDMNQQILKVFKPIFEIQSQHTDLVESFQRILLNYCQMLEPYHDLAETFQKTIANMENSYNGSSIIETSTSLIKTLTETAPVSNDDRYVTVDKNSIKPLNIPDSVTLYVGHNRIRIDLSLFMSILGILISIACWLLPNPLQQIEVNQIIFAILQTAEVSDPALQKYLQNILAALPEQN